MNSITEIPWDKKIIMLCGFFAGPYLLQVSKYKNKNIKKLNWKQDLQTLSAPTNEQFCTLSISLLICSYMFRHKCCPQGAYTNVVKTYRNKIALQWSYISNVQILFTGTVLRIRLQQHCSRSFPVRQWYSHSTLYNRSYCQCYYINQRKSPPGLTRHTATY
jgi:hypothetical protein